MLPARQLRRTVDGIDVLPGHPPNENGQPAGIRKKMQFTPCSDDSSITMALAENLWDTPQLEMPVDSGGCPLPCTDNEVFEVDHVPHLAESGLCANVWFHHLPHLAQSYAEKTDNEIFGYYPVRDKDTKMIIEEATLRMFHRASSSVCPETPFSGEIACDGRLAIIQSRAWNHSADRASLKASKITGDRFCKPASRTCRDEKISATSTLATAIGTPTQAAIAEGSIVAP
jgi:hypothetical protein